MRAASISVTLPSFPIPTLALFSLTLAHQPHPRVNFCPLPSEQCYQAPGGPDDRGFPWVGCHGAPQRSQGLPPDRGALRPGSLDAEIDSLTSMLAELDGGRGHAPRRSDRQVTSLSHPCSLSPALFHTPHPGPFPRFSTWYPSPLPPCVIHAGVSHLTRLSAS